MSYSKYFPVSLGLSLGAAMFATTALSETLLWSTVESRMILGIQADATAVQSRMPEGWKAITLPQGPLAGANILLVFMDRHLILDPDGKPQQPSSNLVAALMSYGVSKDVEGVRSFITRTFEIEPVLNPHGNSVPVTLTREAGKAVSSENKTTRTEEWQLAPLDGGALDFSISYTAGPLGWTEGGKSQPYTNAMPDVYWIYDYDQAAELVMNTTLGKPLAGEVSLANSIPELEDVFDGTEKLVAIVNIPIYIRDVSAP